MQKLPILSVRLAVQIVVGLSVFAASSEASCATLSKQGYTVNGTVDPISCKAFGGAWVSDCCMPCSVNLLAEGSIVVDNKEIFHRMDEVLSFKYTNQPKVLQLLPGLYTRPGNCESTINYDSIQIIGVCGNAFTKIDCNRSAYHFKLTGRNITIQGLALVNGISADNGGCISIIAPATGVTLVDSFLFNCVSYKNGGAISLISTDLQQLSESIAISMIGECRIENCSATNSGGALYVMVARR
jgi:hypothetical protein